MKQKINIKKQVPIVIYGVKRKDINLRLQSQSGGICTVIAEYHLNHGGVMYACGINSSLDVEYMCIKNISDLEKIKGSKYVRANLKNTFGSIVNDLKNNQKVLFVGTSCVVSGLKKLIENTMGITGLDNLYTIDFICHGTPSHAIYREYLSFMENKFNRKISSFDFRKKFPGGWGIHEESIVFNDGFEYQGRIYTDLFYSNFVLRPTCSECKYASYNRCSDFTVADFWGIEKTYPDFYDKNGVSLLFCNTKKSMSVFNLIIDEIEYIKVNANECRQPNLMSPTRIPKNRNRFWECLKKQGFEKTMIKYTNYGGGFTKLKRKLLRRIDRW